MATISLPATPEPIICIGRRTFISRCPPVVLASAGACAMRCSTAFGPSRYRPDCSKYMQRYPAVIPNDVPRPDARQDHAVGFLHAMLEADLRGGRFQDQPNRPRDGLSIIGMHQRHETARGLMTMDRGDAEKVV